MDDSKVNLKSKAEFQEKVNGSFLGIDEVISQFNIDDVVGLVTAEERQNANAQVKVRFAELGGPRMNMIAFD